MKYIKSYANNSEYEAAKTSADFLTPNVGYIEDSKEVKWLNSKRDLYDIYGTLTGGSATATIVLNGNKYYTIRAIDGNEYGFNFPIEVNSFMFEGNNARNIKTIDKLVFNTNSLTGMTFSQCGGLTNIDLSRVDTSRVTNMAEMFYDCHSLTSLDLSDWNTSAVANMRLMFDNCSSLTTLDVSSFNTSGVTNMEAMFRSCARLTSLDVSNFDTSKVTSMANMFYQCSGLTSLDVSNFNTSKVTSMSNMFYQCSGLTSLNVSNFNTSGVTNMGNMFNNCSAITTLDLSNFDTSAVTNMTSMFRVCDALTTLTMNNTSEATFDKIKAQLVSDNVASHVTIIRDGVNWKYQNGAWVEA